jgi:DNA-binding response OmpR family regulator
MALEMKTLSPTSETAEVTHAETHAATPPSRRRAGAEMRQAPPSATRLPGRRDHHYNPLIKPKILIVDDEKDLVKLIRYNLEKRFRVTSVGDAETGLKKAAEFKPDCIILDIMLPGMDGLEFLRALRRDSKTPVILLSAKRSETDRILGLKLGADDYVVKPFSVGELEARVEGLLRRTGPAAASAASGSIVKIGGLDIDFERHEVMVRGKPARLAPKEFEILRLLVQADGKVLSRERLLQTIWGYGEDVQIDTRTVDQHVARLRRKLGPERERVATVSNFGYQLKR